MRENKNLNDFSAVEKLKIAKAYAMSFQNVTRKSIATQYETTSNIISKILHEVIRDENFNFPIDLAYKIAKRAIFNSRHYTTQKINPVSLKYDTIIFERYGKHLKDLEDTDNKEISTTLEDKEVQALIQQRNVYCYQLSELAGYEIPEDNMRCELQTLIEKTDSKIAYLKSVY